MIASDHDKTEALSIQPIKNAQRFLTGWIFFLRDYTLSIKCNLYSAQ